MTLRFLATGHSFNDLEADFKIHRTAICGIAIEVCNAIYDCLKDEYLKIQQTKEDWKRIAEKTQETWQFPNCIGAANGKHISILHPKDSESDLYNYKCFFSIVILVIVDYDYKFLSADVGCQRRISDGDVFRNSAFNKGLERYKLNLPDPAPLSTSTDPTWPHEQNDPLSYVFVIDDAFPLGKHCMKPYSQTYLVFGAVDFACLKLQWCFHRKKSCHYNTCIGCTSQHTANKRAAAVYCENALDSEDEDGPVTEGNWRIIWRKFSGQYSQEQKQSCAKNGREGLRYVC